MEDHAQLLVSLPLEAEHQMDLLDVMDALMEVQLIFLLELEVVDACLIVQVILVASILLTLYRSNDEIYF